MPRAKKTADHETHRKLAIDLFDRVWDLLGTIDRTTEDEDNLVHAAAPAIPLGRDRDAARVRVRGVADLTGLLCPGSPRGRLASREALLGGLRGGRDRGDLDLASAFEALARACAVGGEIAKRHERPVLAERATETIEDERSRRHTLNEVATVKGMGMPLFRTEHRHTALTHRSARVRERLEGGIMQPRCPGLSGQRLTSTVLPCPKRGGEVEIFSDESKARCPRCKTPVHKKAIPSCAKWCKAAAECMRLRAHDADGTEVLEERARRSTRSES